MVPEDDAGGTSEGTPSVAHDASVLAQPLSHAEPGVGGARRADGDAAPDGTVGGHDRAGNTEAGSPIAADGGGHSGEHSDSDGDGDEAGDPEASALPDEDVDFLIDVVANLQHVPLVKHVKRGWRTKSHPRVFWMDREPGTGHLLLVYVQHVTHTACAPGAAV